MKITSKPDSKTPVAWIKRLESLRSYHDPNPSNSRLVGCFRKIRGHWVNCLSGTVADREK